MGSLTHVDSDELGQCEVRRIEIPIASINLALITVTFSGVRGVLF